MAGAGKNPTRLRTEEAIAALIDESEHLDVTFREFWKVERDRLYAGEITGDEFTLGMARVRGRIVLERFANSVPVRDYPPMKTNPEKASDLERAQIAKENRARAMAWYYRVEDDLTDLMGLLSTIGARGASADLGLFYDLFDLLDRALREYEADLERGQIEWMPEEWGQTGTTLFEMCRRWCGSLHTLISKRTS